MSLAGRTAIVTGSTKGIGRAIAEAYARAGMRVVIHSRSEGDCAVVAAELTRMTKVLAIEWARHGVRVNSIAPGYVETEMVRGLAARGILDRERLARRAPMGRLAAPEEVTGAALYLASDEASYVTGTVVTVDGGWSAYGYV